jgi:signal transduction histidine kinase
MDRSNVEVVHWLRRPLAQDIALALALFALSLVTVTTGRAESVGSPNGGPSGVVLFVLVLFATLPIALRRRLPLEVFAITLTAGVISDLIGGPFQFAGALVGLYTVATYVGRPRSIYTATAAGVAAVVTAVGDSGTAMAQVVAILAVFAGAWLLGDNIRTRRAYLRELEDRADRLEREREESIRRAAAEEQARIARELHDIITHNVSVMTVQAAAAGDVFDTQPGRVREALDSIESTGREALTELRRLLGRVRPVDDCTELAPQPGLARLDGLLEQVRAAGLQVDLSIEGTPRELPIGLDLSAYRIVQEALTNILKHAQASKATVHIRYEADAIELEVVDDGRGPAPDEAQSGQGIIGMRERAALVGGALRVGRAPGGGFAVDARIPLPER